MNRPMQTTTPEHNWRAPTALAGPAVWPPPPSQAPSAPPPPCGPAPGRAFLTEAEPVRLAAALYLTVVGPFYAFHGLGLSLYFASQGAGAVAWPVVFTAVRLVVTAGGGYLAVETLELGFEALPVVVAASMVVLGLGNAAAIFAGAWRRANPAA